MLKWFWLDIFVQISQIWSLYVGNRWSRAWDKVAPIYLYFVISYNLHIWNLQGKAFTSVEPGTHLNDLCVIQGSGLFFLANEAPKMLTYYIPVSIETCFLILPTYLVVVWFTRGFLAGYWGALRTIIYLSHATKTTEKQLLILEFHTPSSPWRRHFRPPPPQVGCSKYTLQFSFWEVSTQ
jgi:hypothetical protein